MEKTYWMDKPIKDDQLGLPIDITYWDYINFIFLFIIIYSHRVLLLNFN